MLRGYLDRLMGGCFADDNPGLCAAVLVIAAANVAHRSGPIDETAVAGEAFIAGAYVYLKDSDRRYYKAQCDGSLEEAGAVGHGMALATADAAAARVDVALPGSTIAIGAGTLGTIMCIARAAGSITPSVDIIATDKVTPIGTINAANQIKLFDGYTGAII